MRYYILRRRNEDTEGDKYMYHMGTVNGVEMTTPFKEKAKIYSEDATGAVTVLSDDWKFIRTKIKK